MLNREILRKLQFQKLFLSIFKELISEEELIDDILNKENEDDNKATVKNECETKLDTIEPDHDDLSDTNNENILEDRGV